MGITQIFVFWLSILLFIQITLSFECFECDTLSKLTCTPPFVRDCSEDRDNNSLPPTCLSLEIETYEGVRHNLRTCGLSHTANRNCDFIRSEINYGSNLNLKSTKCKVCDTQRCNNAMSIGRFSDIITVTIAFANLNFVLFLIKYF